jgi:hypothetical protein
MQQNHPGQYYRKGRKTAGKSKVRLQGMWQPSASGIEASKDRGRLPPSARCWHGLKDKANGE